MDNDLVDFAMKCPVSLKLNNLDNIIGMNENDTVNKREEYFQKTNDGKQILRDVMKNYIPNDITNAQKQGFSSPDSSWFKRESLNFVKNKLFGSNTMLYDYMDRNVVESLVNEHFKGKKNRRLFIWSLLNVNEYLDGIIND